MSWADKVRKLKVRTNAETPLDARTAREFGAEGIGLCRTEHMFFDGTRIVAMREMIMADTVADRKKALAKILPMQRQDFIELFKIMRGLPVTIRLLDPPLHEFLPNTREEMAEVAAAAGVSADAVQARAAQLHESNPMLGHRGCRLGITYPEIYEMQARAIFEAAAAVHKEIGETVEAEIMIPLVSIPREFSLMKAAVERVAAEVEKATGFKAPYIIGTMIELPRAALLAGEIAKDAQFFSFGTNDLTQTTYGLSRDDAARFIASYERQGIIKQDPFISLDQDGVGELVQIAAERGRKTRKTLKLGICGEHGGDPASIHFCAKVGLDYVSCSPYRVPIAKLAAAQAALAGSDGRKGEG
jgi:pyruvate,orthophosphate dikinase